MIVKKTSKSLAKSDALRIAWFAQLQCNLRRLGGCSAASTTFESAIPPRHHAKFGTSGQFRKTIPQERFFFMREYKRRRKAIR
jgi:hypothetical protein